MIKNIHRIIIAISVVLLSGVLRANEDMDDAMLTRLLVAQNRGDPYTDLLATQHPDYVVFRPLDLPSFHGTTIYLCMLVKSGLNEHNFAFFVDLNKRATVLTESVEGLSKLLQAQRGVNFKTVDRRQFVADLLALYRPNYVRVEVLDSMSVTSDAVKGIDIRLGEKSEPWVSKDGAELGTTWVLREGRDVVIRTLMVSASGKVKISELLRLKKAFVSTSPHD